MVTWPDLDMSADLSVIIVNWNGGELLRRSVESLVASSPSVSYEVIVIDNNSSDESIAALRDSSAAHTLGASLRIVENSDNLGFGRANNQAFTMTRAPLLFLLNPD